MGKQKENDHPFLNCNGHTSAVETALVLTILEEIAEQKAAKSAEPKTKIYDLDDMDIEGI